MSGQSFDVMRSFLGKRVTVTLAYDDPKAKQTGVMHQITEEGEVHLRDDAGVMHYCWPCLWVETAQQDDEGRPQGNSHRPTVRVTDVPASVIALPRLCSKKVVDLMIDELVQAHGDNLAGRHVIVDWRDVASGPQGLGTYIASRVRSLGALPAHRGFNEQPGWWLGERP